MSFKNLQNFIEYLENKGDLLRISTEVSTELEISAITDRTIKSNGPALMFENVKGYDHPVVTNLFGSHQRMAWGLGIENSDELTQKVESVLNIAKTPPSSMIDKLRTLKDLVSLARTQPKIISSAPVQEVVLENDQADLTIFPHLKCWPMDGGKYITLPLVFSKDPITNTKNVGIYRMQVFDKKTAGMHWQTHKVGASHFRSGEENHIQKLEVAVALGGDPVTMWSGVLPIPPDMYEIAVAGVIKNSPIEMVKCKTVDLEVPANSEIILEGYVIPGELRTEGPFGDHTGYYSLEDDYPVFHLTAITHKKNYIYPATVVGKPPSEDFFMGKAVERLMLPALKLTLPEIKDVNMPAEGVFHNLIIVSMKKQFPGHTRKVMNALWGLGQMMLVKGIIVVDDFVDVQNLSEVAWRVTSNLDPKNDIVIIDGPIDDLDHSSSTPKIGSKIGLDATTKTKMDGRDREWPPDVEMDPEILDLINQKWTEYGFK